jgi:hypothetical protein
LRGALAAFLAELPRFAADFLAVLPRFAVDFLAEVFFEAVFLAALFLRAAPLLAPRFAADFAPLRLAATVFFFALFLAALFLPFALRPPFDFLVVAMCSSCWPHAVRLSTQYATPRFDPEH